MYAARVGHDRDRYATLIDEIQREFPRFRVICKDCSRLQRFCHYGLAICTLGGMRSYLDGYQTTIGRTVYVTPDWDRRDADERYVTMRHERVHLRQFRRYGLLGMALLYLFLPLPMGLAYFRARLEMEAYEETIRAAASVWGIDHVTAPAFRGRIVSQFLGASYGWMWPFRRSIDNWYDGCVAALRQGDVR